MASIKTAISLQKSLLDTEDEFLANSQIQDAIIRRLEIIGEAVKHIPQTVRKNTLRFHGRISPGCGTPSFMHTLV